MSRPKGSEVVTVYPATETDFNGDPVGEPADPYDIEGCVVIPRYSREDETIVVGYTVILWRKDGVRKIQGDDLVSCRGETWAVDGVPGDYVKGRRGVYKGTEMKLTRTTGGA